MFIMILKEDLKIKCKKKKKLLTEGSNHHTREASAVPLSYWAMSNFFYYIAKNSKQGRESRRLLFM
jgi:hypothetical protein